jgi:16S rRNA (adenine1518-N6/adenine1519-N6)-dimethyltransferase
MNKVAPKKHLGQHFLNDLDVAKNIADTITPNSPKNVLEIGPGMGVLTQFLLLQNKQVKVVEIDQESVAYLQQHFPALHHQIIAKDFLKLDLLPLFSGEPFAIIGNFPYNISTQIVFKAIENRHLIPEFSGMFQKEVAERICEKKGSKAYGILSVLTQAFYHCEYLFTVGEQCFNPPPKVKSGVIKLTRKEKYTLEVDEKLFFQVVKTSFNQRRKTLRNSLKSFQLNDILKEDSIFDLRPEQLSVEQFLELTHKIANNGVQNQS